MGEWRRKCELCEGKARVYCPSDSAFLCGSCDVKVHGANFLVGRHLRSCVCSRCGSAQGRRYSGASITLPPSYLCRSCSPTETLKLSGDSLSSSSSPSSSSSCVSSTTDAGQQADSLPRRREKGIAPAAAVDSKVEGVLVNWCRRMALHQTRTRKVVHTALDFLGGCVNGITFLPFRVSLTVSLWVAIRASSPPATCQDLRNLEQISGVPAKLVLATESRLARLLKLRRSRHNHQEGWAES